MAKSTRAPRKRGNAQSLPDHTLWVRAYCQGLGDCHLLTFPGQDKNGQDKPFRILIDCGIHGSVSGGNETIDAVVADVATVCGYEAGKSRGHIDVLVVTHEHIDHTSGFRTASEQFDKIDFGQVWMAWTEDDADPQAQGLDKYKIAALSALQAASLHMHSVSGHPDVDSLREGVDSLLGFYFGAKGDSTRAARNAAKARSRDIRYLEPTDAPIPVANGKIRTYILGPSRDASWLKITDRDTEMYGLAGASAALWSAASPFGASAWANTSADSASLTPFDVDIGEPLDEVIARASARSAAGTIERFIHDLYTGPSLATQSDQSWRRIDHDWLSAGADLAMQLDAKTNNTSLVLAFEDVATGRVFLFTADAQIGSWLSWQDTKWTVDGAEVTGPDLLKRTVYLKVGHHGSQNATAQAKGLELMVSPDLSGFIPTKATDAVKVKWHAMPFQPILTRLGEMTNGRVVRADDAWLKTGIVPDQLKNAGSLADTRPGPDGLFVDFYLR